MLGPALSRRYRGDGRTRANALPPSPAAGRAGLPLGPASGGLAWVRPPPPNKATASPSRLPSRRARRNSIRPGSLHAPGNLCGGLSCLWARHPARRSPAQTLRPSAACPLQAAPALRSLSRANLVPPPLPLPLTPPPLHPLISAPHKGRGRGGGTRRMGLAPSVPRRAGARLPARVRRNRPCAFPPLEGERLVAPFLRPRAYASSRLACAVVGRGKPPASRVLEFPPPLLGWAFPLAPAAPPGPSPVGGLRREPPRAPLRQRAASVRVTLPQVCPVFQPLETFFPIVGKQPKLFSNRWKTPAPGGAPLAACGPLTVGGYGRQGWRVRGRREERGRRGVPIPPGLRWRARCGTVGGMIRRRQTAAQTPPGCGVGNLPALCPRKSERANFLENPRVSITLNQRVVGSSPSASTILKPSEIRRLRSSRGLLPVQGAGEGNRRGTTGRRTRKNFSNHWKKRTRFSNHWKIFFQPLEKPGRIFQPLENFFPTIGKIRHGVRHVAVAAGGWGMVWFGA